MKDKVLTTIDEHYVPLSSISAISGFYYHDLGSKWCPHCKGRGWISNDVVETADSHAA